MTDVSPMPGLPPLSDRAAGIRSLADRIAAANAQVLERLAGAGPVLLRVRPAHEVIPDLRPGVLLHAGPPIEADALCGPMRGAAAGALVYEKWADTIEDAETAIGDGGVVLRCTHDAGVVGPMAGIVSGSMPLFTVRDPESGTLAHAPINEGTGAVLRFGACDETVVARLRWLEEVLGPALDRGLLHLGGLPLFPLMARALQMGDEMHQRNVAATGLCFRALAPPLAEAGLRSDVLGPVLGFLADNDQFFLNLAMAAAKAALDGARGIAGSTIVTAMSRNGVTFGIRVSGLGDRWFTAPAPLPAGLYFPGFGAGDANPDMGDSAILETLGLGAFAMAAAPAVAGFVGYGGAAAAQAATREMGEITLGRSATFTMPSLDGEGVPVGIDIRRVVRLGTTPLINTGIAHRGAGVGQIGAGVARAPLAAFEDAISAFAEQYARHPASLQ